MIGSPEGVLALLIAAQSHIYASQLDEAAALYLTVLYEPALAELPSASIEVLANYGALLLREALEVSDGGVLRDKLDRAIDMLLRAQDLQRRAPEYGNPVITNANLALACFQRHVATGQHADLLSAHLALDSAEASLRDADQDLRDWVRSIRNMLVGHVDRRRNTR